VHQARPDRDAFELALAGATGQLDTPVLGVCRGMRVMAMAAGERLEQYLPDVIGRDEHSPGPEVYGSHTVRTLEGTRLGVLLGREAVIPSSYHQCGTAHPGYATSAWAPDGTLQAMESPGSRFRPAVQWHPEAGTDDRRFDASIAVCARPPS